MQSEPRSWREALGKIIQDAQEKRRLAKTLGLDARTLDRWADGTSNPRVSNLIQLIDALPAYRHTLTRLVADEYPDVANRRELGEMTLEEIDPEISPVLYDRILRDRVSELTPLTRWGICKLVLEHCVHHLDSNRSGVAAVLAQCVQPAHSEEKVRGLREEFLEFSRSWPLDRRKARYILGAESLAGIVVSSYQPAIYNDLKQEQIPVRPVAADVISVVTYPIVSYGRVAGCLQMLSVQANYFSPVRIDLVRKYANLLSLAFLEREFYTREDLDLQLMPEASAQLLFLSSFNDRVNQELSRAEQEGRQIDRQQAERLVLQQFLEQQK